MNSRTAYWLKGEREEWSKDTVYVTKDCTLLITEDGTRLEIRNGNRINTARIVRPKPTTPEPQLRYRVTGLDTKMNDVRKTVDTMVEALNTTDNMLHAVIKPIGR